MAEKKAKKPKLIYYVTPQLPCKFAYLFEDDTKGNRGISLMYDPKGPEAEMPVLCNGKETEFPNIIEFLKAKAEAGYKAALEDPANKKVKKKLAQHYPYHEEVYSEWDEENGKGEEGEPTGLLEIKFKQTKEGALIVDKKAQRWNENKKVWTFTPVRLQFVCSPMVFKGANPVGGITLYFDQAQILEKEYKKESVFGAVDDSANMDTSAAEEASDVDEGTTPGNF